MLTEERPIASIPFGGRYRLVDFPLSNMVNSGINTVGLVTPYAYRSLLDHVGNGKAWTLNRKVGGMFILPGSAYGVKNAQGKFLLRDVIRNQAYLERSRRDIVVVTACSKIFNMDFREAAEQHEKSGGGHPPLQAGGKRRGRRAERGLRQPGPGGRAVRRRRGGDL